MRLNIKIATASFAVVLAANIAYGASIFDVINKATSDRIKAIDKATADIARLLPPIQQQTIQRLTDQLKTLELDQLYRLRMPDVCQVGIVTCGTLTPDTVKPLVDNELDRRKAVAEAADRLAAATDRQDTFRISLGSVIVSGLAFLLSLWATFGQGKVAPVES